MINQLKSLINAGNVNFSGQTAAQINQIVENANQALFQFNSSTDAKTRKNSLTRLLGTPLDASSEIHPPFQSDFGAHITIGKYVFINRDCLFVDLGGITLADHVLIGPRVSLISVNHMEEPSRRRNLILKSVKICAGAWIGANAIILPGVTVGENAIVGAGAVVSHDVPANMIVAGVPARTIQSIKTNNKGDSEHD